MSDLRGQLCYRGSVNRWECDENDHLNVRFFSERAWSAAEYYLGSEGLELGSDALRVQHFRFIAEARMATPISGWVREVSVNDKLMLLVELRHSLTDALLAAVTLNFAHEPSPEAVGELPNYAAPRGVDDSAQVYGALHEAELAALGFANIGRGVVQLQECDAAGRLRVPGYMARQSDSMPNFWGLLNPKEQLSTPFMGGAVVEFRTRFRHSLGLGDRFAIWSGVQMLGRKTQHLVHLLCDAQSGTVVSVAQAVGVVMDLEARRAVEIPPQRRAELEHRLLRTPAR